ncbi:MAG: rhomboid family intramembrane serine protease [bacterium]
MVLSPWSWAAIAVMVLALGIAWSKKFVATGTLLIANLVIFVLQLAAPKADPYAAASAVTTQLSFDGVNLATHQPIGYLQTFTAMFLHDPGNLLHILGNSIFLYAFGMPFEERIGARRFVAIYVLGGIAATLVQFVFTPTGIGLGASGAIAAIMGAFAAKYPRLVVPLPVPIFVIMMMIPVPVLLGVGLFLLLQIVNVAALPGGLAHIGVGYAAHIGGLAFGVLLSFLLLRRVSSGGRSEGRVVVDLPKLAPFARDDATRRVLEHMQSNHDEPEVFQAWLDRFFRTATCPTCTHKVLPGRLGQVVCTQGHKFDVRMTTAKPT